MTAAEEEASLSYFAIYWRVSVVDAGLRRLLPSVF